MRLVERPRVQEQDVHARAICSAPSIAGRAVPAVLRALDAERRGELGEELAQPARARPATDAVTRDPADRLRVGARQPRDDPRVRREPDDVAGRQRAVELGHREVLVDDPAVLEEDHPHELVALDAEQEHDRAHPIRELLREPAQHLRVPVADVVVDGDPAVPRRRDDRPARVAGEPRHELPHRLARPRSRRRSGRGSSRRTTPPGGRAAPRGRRRDRS